MQIDVYREKSHLKCILLLQMSPDICVSITLLQALETLSADVSGDWVRPAAADPRPGLLTPDQLPSWSQSRAMMVHKVGILVILFRYLDLLDY